MPHIPRRRLIQSLSLLGTAIAVLIATAALLLSGEFGSNPSSLLWKQSLPRADGSGPLALHSLQGRPLVVNFWAPWCGPCAREMPEIDQFAAEFAARGGQVIGIAIDQPAAVQNFLQNHPVHHATIVTASTEAIDWMRKLGNPSGSLPFTIVLDAEGSVIDRKSGATTREELLRRTSSLWR
jgi:thiol-disulfide isomerase/thioredoxin